MVRTGFKICMLSVCVGMWRPLKMLKPGRVYTLYVPEITGFVSEGPDLYSDFTAIKPLLWLLFMIDSPESKVALERRLKDFKQTRSI